MGRNSRHVSSKLVLWPELNKMTLLSIYLVKTFVSVEIVLLNDDCVLLESGHHMIVCH